MNAAMPHLSLPVGTYLDCSSEQTEVRKSANSQRSWVAGDLSESNWLVKFDQAALDELHRAADFIAAHPVENMARTPADIELPHCQRYMAKLLEIIDNGVGFAVADRLPVDDFPLPVLVELYWVLGQLVARPVAQKRNGQMIYDVRDTTREYSYGVRGSWTNVELNFHTDNAFGKQPPDYVGLFCRHPAMSGGLSRFCSLYTLHDRLEQYHPKDLQRLHQPMLYDRQKEHDDAEPLVTLAPFFSWRGGKLRARANPSLVRKGYDVAGIEMEPELAKALTTVDEVSQSKDLWYEAALEKGQIQYLNNSEVGHYRSEFQDFEEEELKRHLYRLWHRNSGSVCYDGATALG